MAFKNLGQNGIIKAIMELNGLKNTQFNSSTHGVIYTETVLFLIKKFLEQDSKAEYSLVIGSDSQEKTDLKTQKKFIDVITAIVVYRKGFGGKYFWKRTSNIKIHSLREKIYAETLASLNFATKFVPVLKKTLNGNTPKYNLEIHVDVGEHGATREMLREVIGMVTGNGFVAKTKPESYAASYVADKHT